MSHASTLPAFFDEALKASYSAADVERIADGLAQRRATTLRANALLSSRSEVASALDAASLPWEEVPWYGDAFVLGDAPASALWELDAYKEGRLYLQSLSSMIPPLLLEPAEGDEILDMCAAPGGKTTQTAALGGRRCYITAVEMSAPRAEKLEFNLARQGAGGVNVLRQDARRLDSFLSYSKVMLDAPCSGSGTLWLGDPKLDKALQLVKPGGLLVYSTCSVLKEENEQQLSAALARASKRASYELEPVELAGGECIPTLPSTLDGALTVCPTALYEGFFACKVRRTA